MNKFIDKVNVIFPLTPTRTLQLFQVGRFGANFLGSALLSRLFGNPTELAVFETMQVWFAALSFAILSGITGIFLPYFFSQTENRQSVYPAAFEISCLFGIGIGTLHWILCYHSLGERYWLETTLFSAYCFLNVSSAVTEYYLVAEERLPETLVYGLLLSIGTLLAYVVPVWLGWSVVGCSFGLLIWGGLKWIVAFQLYRQKRKCKDYKTNKKLYLLAAFPLIGVSLVGGSCEYIDAFLVRHYLTAEDFLWLRYGGREIPISLLLASALSTVAAGRIAAAKTFQERRREYLLLKQETIRFLLWLFPVTIALMLSSQYLFRLLYADYLQPAVKVFDICLLLLVPRAMFPQSVLNGLQFQRLTFRASVLEWLFHVGLSIWLVSWYGVQGIAWTMVLSQFVDKLILIWFCSRLNIKPHWYIPINFFSAMSLLLIFVYCLKVFIIYPNL
ncbi:MAG: polysaccharide biosynthesis C-terminal domain-containing protein [Bacteroidia bacterium]|nr:polysaccharide biosynthesis C-terminal domain-containing protein [Bacteroidia bacterium]